MNPRLSHGYYLKLIGTMAGAMTVVLPPVVVQAENSAIVHKQQKLISALKAHKEAGNNPSHKINLTKEVKEKTASEKKQDAADSSIK